MICCTGEAGQAYMLVQGWTSRYSLPLLCLVWLGLLAVDRKPATAEVFDFEVERSGYGGMNVCRLVSHSGIGFSYGDGGLLSGVTLDGVSVIDDTAYDAGGKMRRLDYASGHFGQYTFDGLGRPEDLRLLDGLESEIYADVEIDYDEWGFLSSQRRRGGAFGTAGLDLEFDYTDLGQLASLSAGNSTAIYGYDSYGNLTSKTGLRAAGLQLLPLSPVAFDEKNQPVEMGWRYDAQGRLTRDDQYEYRYNDRGRLALVLDLHTGDVVSHLLYDSAGHRVRVLDDDSVTYAMRLAGSVFWDEARDPVSGELVERRTHVHHAGSAVYTAWDTAGRREGEFRFVDRLGSPAVRWADAAHAEMNYQEYSPYGEEMILAAQSRHRGPHGFTGHEHDNTGRIYMRARYYDPVLARLNRPDPARDMDLFLPTSLNLYSYTWGNPVNAIDPTGRVVNFTQIQEEDPEVFESILAELSAFTGNEYSVDENGNLVLVSVGANSSETATRFLNSAIESPIQIAVHLAETGRGSSAIWSPGSRLKDGAKVNIDTSQFDTFDYNGVDKLTFGTGSTLLHEIYHAATGKSDSTDGTRNSQAALNQGNPTGVVVDFVNQVRRERGLPIRMQYESTQSVVRTGRSRTRREGWVFLMLDKQGEYRKRRTIYHDLR